MAEKKKIVIDAGHGGWDLGAVYDGRQEKDENLNLALAVGFLLENAGMDVSFTRVNDIYDTPYEKASMANQVGADYFVSIHRNSMPVPNSASGVETLVYANEGIPALMAENINLNLESIGFRNLGINQRPNLVVLNSTQMPAVLVEAGFINNDEDNQLFDQNFEAIAQAIADGIIKTLDEEQGTKMEYYQVQTGAFQNRDLAQKQTDQLIAQGFPVFIVYDDDLFKVRVGAFEYLDNAVKMEQQLRNYGYNTFITRE